MEPLPTAASACELSPPPPPVGRALHTCLDSRCRKGQSPGEGSSTCLFNALAQVHLGQVYTPQPFHTVTAAPPLRAAAVGRRPHLRTQETKMSDAASSLRAAVQQLPKIDRAQVGWVVRGVAGTIGQAGPGAVEAASAVSAWISAKGPDDLLLTAGIPAAVSSFIQQQRRSTTLPGALQGLACCPCMAVSLVPSLLHSSPGCAGAGGMREGSVGGGEGPCSSFEPVSGGPLSAQRSSASGTSPTRGMRPRWTACSTTRWGRQLAR